MPEEYELVGAEDDDDYDTSGDIVGAEIVGDDDLDALVSGDIVGADIVGAVRRKPKRVKLVRRATNRLPAAQVQRQGLAYEPTKYGTWRESVVGIDSGATTIAAGASRTIIVQPQVPFRAERFMVSSAIAGSFVIDDIKVGKNSQFLAAGSVPGTAFSELAVGAGLHLDTAEVAQNISVSVTNTSGGALRFLGAFYGKYVQR